jgi:hypothetical protein
MPNKVDLRAIDPTDIMASIGTATGLLTGGKDSCGAEIGCTAMGSEGGVIGAVTPYVMYPEFIAIPSKLADFALVALIVAKTVQLNSLVAE